METQLQEWVHELLADPVTKQAATHEQFRCVDGILDLRIFLKNTPGYSSWHHSQVAYEESVVARPGTAEHYIKEIEYDRPVYDHFCMGGRVLDCGGGAGLVREIFAAGSADRLY